MKTQECLETRGLLLGYVGPHWDELCEPFRQCLPDAELSFGMFTQLALEPVQPGHSLPFHAYVVSADCVVPARSLQVVVQLPSDILARSNRKELCREAVCEAIRLLQMKELETALGRV